jgi:hypothetical protein
VLAWVPAEVRQHRAGERAEKEREARERREEEEEELERQRGEVRS